MLIKVEEHKDLVRNSNTGAILNVDRDALNMHRRRNSIIVEKEEKINSLEDRVTNLENLINRLLQDKE